MNLLKTLMSISFIMFVSRILGFIRDSITAQIFGVGVNSDAFFVAFKIPNLLRRVFSEGAFSQAFLPILNEYKNKKGKIKTQMFLSYISGILVIILSTVTLIGIISASLVIKITAPGFINIPNKFKLTTKLLRIVFPYVFLISTSSLFSAILNTWDYFLIPAFSPVLLNISMIIFALFAYTLFHPPIMSLAWAILIGGLLQLGYQIPFLRKIDMLMIPKIGFRNFDLYRVMRQMGAAMFGVSISQISLIINTILASFLIPGSVSWIYYADRLIELPSGVFGIAIGTILLPSLSQSIVQDNYYEYSNLLDWGLRLCFILVLPSAIAFGILAHPLIVTLFQYGKFSTFDVYMTQKTLISYSVGLLAIIITKLLALAFYARQDIRTPVRAALFTLLITQIINLFLIIPLKNSGLSWSISISAIVNASILYWKLYYKKLFIPKPGWFNFFYRLFIAIFTMVITLILILKYMPNWTEGNMFIRLTRLFGVIIISIIVYFISLFFTGFRINQFNYLVKI